MQPITACIAAAALIATALGAEEFCDPKSFRATSFDAINFRPAKTTYNANIRALLLQNLPASSQFVLVDFKNGRVYVHEKSGNCTYYENDDVKVIPLPINLT
ncbi:hypothetical protein PoB_001310100 [Plakobranchus ocellatus]|uniref:Uncharacterized protein n=1 Tax=Plakobranchus ocellatus TaxID=259542 RepID=A0AAV3YT65_9GAST|nr:hypothetical protein PoB_001310100 [Plakobranchus ocellatus]